MMQSSAVSRIALLRASLARKLLLGPPLLGHVPEDQHDAEQLARRIPDRGRTVVNRPLRSVPGDQDGVVRKPDDDAFPQHFVHGVLDRLFESAR